MKKKAPRRRVATSFRLPTPHAAPIAALPARLDPWGKKIIPCVAMDIFSVSCCFIGNFAGVRTLLSDSLFFGLVPIRILGTHVVFQECVSRMLALKAFNAANIIS